MAIKITNAQLSMNLFQQSSFVKARATSGISSPKSQLPSQNLVLWLIPAYYYSLFIIRS